MGSLLGSHKWNRPSACLFVRITDAESIQNPGHESRRLSASWMGIDASRSNARNLRTTRSISPVIDWLSDRRSLPFKTQVARPMASWYYRDQHLLVERETFCVIRFSRAMLRIVNSRRSILWGRRKIWSVFISSNCNDGRYEIEKYKPFLVFNCLNYCMEKIHPILIS